MSGLPTISRKRCALISGARGQMASLMADLLLEKGYFVVAFERRSGTNRDYSNIEHLLDNSNYKLEIGDLCDFSSLVKLLTRYHPDEFYNFAALSHVHQSFDQPLETCEVNFNGVANVLESVRWVSPHTKIYHASTSEVYGDVITETQDENSPVRPQSPYGAAKAGAESLIRVYREAYGLFAFYTRNFNSEGHRRNQNFVTRKITSWISDVLNKTDFDMVQHYNGSHWEMSFCGDVKESIQKLITSGEAETLKLGNLESKRDWQDCRDTVRGIWQAMQREEPDDFVLGSGKSRTIREFLDAAFAAIGIEDWSSFVEVDPKFYRPAEVNTLCADPSKAKSKIGWENTISFEDMVYNMILSDIRSKDAHREKL